MTQILSRALTLDPVALAKIELAEEVAVELDTLVEHLSCFLELRLKEEFDELREDIAQARSLIAVNDALIEENMRFRHDITSLSMQLLQQAAHG